MAHGAWLATGRPQAVMVHVTVGTANAACGIITAARSQVPILMSAGRTPITEEGPPGSRDLYIHWAQESFDQGAMLREYVKWDYELRVPSQVEAVVDRAFELMLSEPRGPVYLTLPREVLAAPLPSLDITSPARRQVAALRLPDPARVEEAARLLAAARHPLILVSGAGRDPAAVPALVALAEAGGIGVVEVDPTHVNFPQSHPLHVGFTQPSGTDPALGEADVILVVDADVPWYPSLAKPGRRRRGDPPRRRSRVLALSHAELPVRRAHRRASRGGAAAPRGCRAAPRRPRGGGRAAGARRGDAPGAARALGGGRRRAGRMAAPGLRLGHAVSARSARRLDGGREQPPAAMAAPSSTR